MKQIPFILETTDTQLPLLNWVSSCDSTQNVVQYLMNQMEFQKVGVACFTYNQTHGKGQGKNNWSDSPDRSIAYSIALPLSESLDLVLLNKYLTLQVCEVIQSFLNERVFIKWPNDLMCLDRKLSGLLMQVQSNDFGMKYLVLGIGINVNQTNFEHLPKAISMKLVEKKEFDLEQIVKKLHLELALSTLRLPDTLNFKSQEINSQFNLNLWKHEQQVECVVPNQPKDLENSSVDSEVQLVKVQIKEVDSAGRLVVLQDSAQMAYHHGQIKLLL